MREIILIAAVSENNTIGLEGKLPWKIPEDLKRFRELTTPYPIIMGRKTYESIGRPLKNRLNIVLSKNTTFEEVITARTVKEALLKAKETNDFAYIIGGEQIYKQTMPLATRLEITKVHKDVKGDAFFPEITNDWKLIVDDKRDGYSFRTYLK